MTRLPERSTIRRCLGLKIGFSIESMGIGGCGLKADIVLLRFTLDGGGFGVVLADVPPISNEEFLRISDSSKSHESRFRLRRR